jgi:hypothetical protein
MPEWLKGSLIIAVLGIWAIHAIVVGKVGTPYGTYSRAEEPELFYANAGLLIFMAFAGLFLLLIQLGVVPDFIHR